MKLRSLFATLALCTGLVSAVSAKTVVEIAIGSPDHTTLVAAVKAAGLVETLSGAGPFTVFAPTNAAFAKLPAGTVDSLLKPENKAKLVAILTYHVVPAKVMAADVKTGEAPSVNGKKLALKADKTGVTVNGAKVVAADLVGSNGGPCRRHRDSAVIDCPNRKRVGRSLTSVGGRLFFGGAAGGREGEVCRKQVWPRRDAGVEGGSETPPYFDGRKSGVRIRRITSSDDLVLSDA